MSNPVIGIVGAVFVVGAVFIGSIGYQKEQSTGVESFASGVITLGVAFDSAGRDQAEKDLQHMEKQRLRRAVPYYVVAFFAGVVGVFLLARYARSATRDKKPFS